MAARNLHPLRRLPPPVSSLPPAPRPRRFAAWCGLLTAGTLGLAVAFSQPAVESWLLARWNTAIANYSADEAAGAMQRAADNGDWGRTLLLAALDSPNDEARLAAGQTLFALVERWKQDAAVDHSVEIVELAKSLAERAPRWSPLQVVAIEPLLTSVANWRLNSKAPHAAQFVADCETLVRLLQEHQPTRIAVKPRLPIPAPSPPPPVENNPTPPTEAPAAIRQEFVPEEPLPRATQTPLPRETSPTPAPSEPSPDLMLDLLPAEPDAIRRIEPPREPRRRPLPSVPVPNTSPRTTSAVEEMRRLSDWEVITYLHAENGVQTVAAEEELSHRGYRRIDLAVARRAADPQPMVRQRLAEDLPRLSGVDSRRWLLQLAEDPHPQVSLTARNILKTARDPALQR